MALWDNITVLLSNFGVTGETALAVAQAMAAPTKDNIEAVENAFHAEGAQPPPELMEVLWGRYYDSIQKNPIYFGTQVAQWTPFVLGGLVGLLLLSKIRKRR